MKLDLITQDVELPQGVTVAQDGHVVTAKGPKGEVSRKLFSRMVDMKIEKEKVVFSAKDATKREKRLIGTFSSHLRNMVRGVVEGHVYKLKICSGHFPMNVSVKGEDFVVKNFMGEKVPRTLRLKGDVQVQVKGTEVIVESVDKELAGQTAASIERVCRRVGFDSRIFQDGIYITEKDGKPIR